MPLVINSNLASLSARTQLTTQIGESSTAMERLTTGKRINTAADDSAGLQVANRMTTQVREAQVSVKNANDGISLAQVAEGALDIVGQSVQRIRELTVQAANGTYTAAERVSMQAEADQLSVGIEQTLNAATFNGLRVFGEASSLTGDDAIEFALEKYWVPESEKLIERFFGLNGRDMNLAVNIGTIDGVGGTLASVARSGVDPLNNGAALSLTLNIERDDFSPPNLPNGGSSPVYNDRIIAHEMVHAVMAANMNLSNLPAWFLEGSAEIIHGADERVAADLAAATSAALLVTAANLDSTLGVSPTTSAGYSVGYIATKMLHEAAGGGEDGLKNIMSSLASGRTFDEAIQDNTAYDLASFETHVTTNGAAFLTSQMDLSNSDTGSINGSDYGREALSKEDVLANNATGGIVGDFQLTGLNSATNPKTLDIALGKNAQNLLSIEYSFTDVGGIGVRDLDITDTEWALSQLDYAIDEVSKLRADYGILQTRLNSNINRMSETINNTSDARSRILDADFASETASLSRSQVLQQAAQAMLAQANAAPQEVLSLLQ